MRHIVQKFFASEPAIVQRGFFGFSPKTITSLVGLSWCLYNKNEAFHLDQESVTVSEGFHNDILKFVGIDDADVDLKPNQSIQISSPQGTDDILVLVKKYGEGRTGIIDITIPAERTPFATKIKDIGYFYTDNPVSIILAIFEAYRNRELFSISLAPFGPSRWNQRVFYRLFIEAFNMVVTNESQGANYSSRHFLDTTIDEPGEISTTHGLSGIREMVVKGCYGHANIVMDFRNIERSGDCFFAVGHGSSNSDNGVDNQQAAVLAAMGRDRRHPVSLVMYRYNIKEKAFLLNPDFFVKDSALGFECKTAVAKPPQIHEARVGGKRLRIKTTSRYYLLDSLISARILGEFFEFGFTPPSLRPGITYEDKQFDGKLPELFQWYIDTTAGVTENGYISYSPSKTVMIESSTVVREDEVLWKIRIFDVLDFKKIVDMSYDISAFVVRQPACGHSATSDKEIWHIDAMWLAEMLFCGFERLVGETLRRLLSNRLNEIVIEDKGNGYPSFDMKPTGVESSHFSDSILKDLDLRDDANRIVISSAPGLTVEVDEEDPTVAGNVRRNLVYTYSSNGVQLQPFAKIKNAAPRTIELGTEDH